MLKHKTIIAVGLVVVLVISGVCIYQGTREDKKEVVSKETTVAYGNLTVGVTESGSVTIGNVEQSLSFVSSENGNTNTSTSTGNQMTATMGMGSAAMGTGSNASNTSLATQDIQLKVEEVYVSVGQVVEKGVPLLKLTKESVSDAKTKLQQSLHSAKLSLKKAKIERESTKISADYEYEENLALGKSAKKDYNATLKSLKNVVDLAQSEVVEAEARMEEIPKEIKALQEKKKTIKESATTESSYASLSGENMGSNRVEIGNQENSNGSLTNEYSVEGTDTSTVSGVNAKIASLKSELSALKSNYGNLVSRLSQAKSDQIAGKISAKALYDETMINYENAKEIYEIAIDGIDEQVNEAKDAVQEAKDQLSNFKKTVSDGVITTNYAGTILSVGYTKGDEISTDTPLATYADASEVNLTVSVSQEDISQVKVGEVVNIVFHAYEETMYSGVVAGIATSESSDNSATVNYDVTVNVTGDVSKIYEGMTANVTFVTKEKRDVLYVSNKAIITEGIKSYVKKVEGEEVIKVNVITGFSNGTNVEIEKGLQEGDVVLIESQVSGS